jgi:hypothetical protein
MSRFRFSALCLLFAGVPLCAATSCSGGLAFPHIVDGSGWKTSFYLLNQTSADADYTLVFHDDAGNPDILHFADGRADNQISGTVPAGGVAILETTGQDADALNAAAATLKTGSPNALTGFTILRERQKGGPDFEASIPLTPASADAWAFPFDNTAGFATGIALSEPCAGHGSIAITLDAFDESGKSLGKASLSIPVGGHKAFLVADQIPATREKRGVVRMSYDKTASGALPLAGIGLRFAPSGALATLPPAVSGARPAAVNQAPARKLAARHAR